jgi:hypothetical protein
MLRAGDMVTVVGTDAVFRVSSLCQDAAGEWIAMLECLGTPAGCHVWRPVPLECCERVELN